MSWTAVYSRKSQVLGQIPRRDLVAQQYEKIDKEIKEQQDNDLLKDFPKNRIEENVWRWLDEFQRRRLKPYKTPSVYHRTKSKGKVTGAQGDCQLDLIIKRRGLPAAESTTRKTSE